MEWVRRSAYNPAGLLLSVTFGEEDKAVNVYHYDDQGRLQSITDSRRPDHLIVFRYDASGRKTRIATISPAAYPPGTAVAISAEALFETPELTPLPDGGRAVTLYDAQDRPTEVQLYDPVGTLVRRFVRMYDDRGNIIDERQTLQDPLSIFPTKDQGDLLSKTGGSAQDLRAELAKFLGPFGEVYSSHYEYDQEGRKTLGIRMIFHHAQDRTETSYNDHGDVGRGYTVVSNRCCQRATRKNRLLRGPLLLRVRRQGQPDGEENHFQSPARRPAPRVNRGSPFHRVLLIGLAS